MSTEHNQTVVEKSSEEKLVENTQQFLSKNNKKIITAVVALIVIVGGYFSYKQFIQKPAELAANDAVWTAQLSFKSDSFQLALNGDGTKNNPGLLKVISGHSGTKAANLASYYAGISYLKLGDFNNAIKFLEGFSTNESETLLRKNGSLGDAYAELGKNDDAVKYYKKASTDFIKDEVNSSEYRFRLGLLYDKMGNTSEAIETLKSLKTDFPQTMRANEVDKYLAKLGETN